jgi:nitrogen fixation-related uncharacterized protein
MSFAWLVLLASLTLAACAWLLFLWAIRRVEKQYQNDRDPK